jgi:hypothetical protein
VKFVAQFGALSMGKYEHVIMPISDVWLADKCYTTSRQHPKSVNNYSITVIPAYNEEKKNFR